MNDATTRSGTATSSVPTVDITPDVSIPQLGIGVWQVDPSTTARVVDTALATGYRLIDTAASYKNEAGVGEAIGSSGMDRDSIFVTSKLANPDQGYDKTLLAFDATLEALGLEQLDLYLIHWPRPMHDLYVDTWRALIEIQKTGRVRAIGVSNFQIEHLDRLAQETGVTPALNQIELHPQLRQTELRAYHARNGIATEAWSPLANGGILQDPILNTIAARHGKSPAQIVIRWHLEIGNIVIPKSVTPSRIAENFDVFDFELTERDRGAIESMPDGQRTGGHPDTFGA